MSNTHGSKRKPSGGPGMIRPRLASYHGVNGMGCSQAEYIAEVLRNDMQERKREKPKVTLPRLTFMEKDESK